MKPFIELREYQFSQPCGLCRLPVKKCIFYQCECGNITFKLCEHCSTPSKTDCIRRCPFCTTEEEARQKLDFSLFLPFK